MYNKRMRWAIRSAVLVFALAFVSSPARADKDAAEPYFIAATASATAIPIDLTIWAGAGTTELRNHWAWHFIPIAGPIIGFTSLGRDFSSCEDPQAQWCKPFRVILYVYQSIVLALETVGVVALGVGIYKLQQPSKWETSSRRLAPKTWLAPQRSPRIMPQVWTTQQTAWFGASGTW